jgi:hypothetical protein
MNENKQEVEKSDLDIAVATFGSFLNEYNNLARKYKDSLENEIEGVKHKPIQNIRRLKSDFETCVSYYNKLAMEDKDNFENHFKEKTDTSANIQNTKIMLDLLVKHSDQ